MRLQHGFSLVEVLITLLILKVGLLGVLAAQTLSLRQLQDAIQRTQAVALSNGLFSEIQSNPRLAELIGPQLTLHSELPAAPDCTLETRCNAGQLAAAQLSDWFDSLQTSAGSGLYNPVFCLQSQGGLLRLAVSWQQRATEQAPTTGCEASAGRSAFAVQGGAR